MKALEIETEDKNERRIIISLSLHELHSIRFALQFIIQYLDRNKSKISEFIKKEENTNDSENDIKDIIQHAKKVYVRLESIEE